MSITTSASKDNWSDESGPAVLSLPAVLLLASSVFGVLYLLSA